MSTDTTKYLSTTEFANREIDHSIIPARDGRKRDTIMIPEHELDKLDILINSGKAEKVEPKVDPIIEKPLLTTKEVAELLGCHVTNVALMVTNGKLKPARNDMRGSRNSYKFDEDYILKYMEEHPKHANKKKETPVDDKTFEIENLKAQVEVLRAMLNERDKTIDELLEEKDEKPEVESFAKDIFEAYRKGFKDGFEMGGKH